jgi:hypothetical protein
MPFLTRLKHPFKSSQPSTSTTSSSSDKENSNSNNSNSDSSKQKKATSKPSPLLAESERQQKKRAAAKPYQDLFERFGFSENEQERRRKSSAGNVSPMGSRRASLISFRRKSSSASVTGKESESGGKKALHPPGHHGKPHSGDPRTFKFSPKTLLPVL